MQKQARKKCKYENSIQKQVPELLDIPNESMIKIMMHLTNNDLFAFSLSCTRTIEVLKWGIRSSRLHKRILVDKRGIIKELIKWEEPSETVNEILYYTNTASKDAVQEIRKIRNHDHLDNIDILPETGPGVTVDIALLQTDDTFSNERAKIFKDLIVRCSNLERIQIQNNYYEGSCLFDFDCLYPFKSHNEACITKKTIDKLFSINSHLQKVFLVCRSKDNFATMNVTKPKEVESWSADLMLKDSSRLDVGITDREFERIIKNVKNISQITIHGKHENLTDLSIKAIATNLNRKLEKLEISKMYKITDEGLNFIGKYCPNINSFKLNSCYDRYGYALDYNNKYVTEKAIVGLLTQVKLKTLHLVNLDIRVEGFYEIIQLSENLEELNLKGNENSVSEEVMDGISQYCKNLRSLNLSYNYGFSISDLQKVLSKVGSQLKSLDISDCEYIEYEDVTFIPQLCPSLEYLHITGCEEECMNLLKSKIKTVETEDESSFDTDTESERSFSSDNRYEDNTLGIELEW